MNINSEPTVHQSGTICGDRAVNAAIGSEQVAAMTHDVRRSLKVVRDRRSGRIDVLPASDTCTSEAELIGVEPPLYPEWLGDQTFLDTHGLRFPYVAGAMARGIATTQMVISVAQAGMLGFLGSAGLPVAKGPEAIDSIQAGCAAVNLGVSI